MPQKAANPISPQKISELFENLNVGGTTNQNVSRMTREQKHAQQLEADACSIFISNISLVATPEEIDEYFHDCGTIKRITMLYDKKTGPNDGYAYLEFDSVESRDKALKYDGKIFLNNKIGVQKKRTNVPNFSKTPQNRKVNPDSSILPLKS
ncbi:Uncharacterized protein RNJ44_04878 [Nakaseomyces bracarensis]|uniref:RRM domain-containing protein n=1 Tax=Nakaseomyces bracarensis TaxID=273131 RepID=A0ABR4NW48_9SACH